MVKCNSLVLKFCFTGLLTLSIFVSNGQYVTIPDTAFVTFLKSIGYGPCFNGNQMDTTCSIVMATTSMDCSGLPIRDLTGIQYFKAMDYLDCSQDSISFIPALPASINTLNAQHNELASFPTLPANLYSFACYNNKLTSLPALPTGLQMLWCDSNSLTSLPALPTGLWYLECWANQLSGLPTLPDSLKSLWCDYNRITEFPPLPAKLRGISCTYNLLTSLPDLLNLGDLDCRNNPDLHCLPQIGTMNELDFDSLNILCVPDYGTVNRSTPLLSSVPLCGVYNPYGCQSFWNISGQAYYDFNNNCLIDSSDVGQKRIKIKLYNNGILNQQLITGSEGFYSFQVPYGNYTIETDTTDLPFFLSCPDSGFLSSSITPTDSFSYNNNFGFRCRSQGFDVGVQSIITHSISIYDHTFHLYTVAGDISQVYGAHCISGLGGQVKLSFTGPIHYLRPDSAALIPSQIIGDTVIWNVADFGQVNVNNAFNLILVVDSNAIPGNMVCFNVAVTPVTGDFNQANNNMSFCLALGAPFDPNEKEAYPADYITPSTPWITYTIHFQNTGNAIAHNIYISDTLDSGLDPSTIQLLTSSSASTMLVTGNAIRFTFPNINLPDSSSGYMASTGYIQYRIKPSAHLSPGYIIGNQASIYFDANLPVVTNQAYDTVVSCMPDHNSLNVNICNGDTILFGTKICYQTGIFIDTLTNLSGCDSIIKLTLLVTQPDTISSLTTLCVGDSFNFYGRYVFGPGNYDTLLPGGCDTLIHLTVTMRNSVAPHLVYDTICAGDSLLFNGIYIDSVGGYIYHLTTSGTGCDSTVNLFVSIRNTPVIIFDLPADSLCNKANIIDLNASPVGGNFSGNGISGTQFNPANAAIGRDTIIYTYIDNNGCVAFKTDNVQVFTFPASISIDTLINALGIISLYVESGIAGHNTWQKMNIVDSSIINVFIGDTFTVGCFSHVGAIVNDTISGLANIRVVTALNGCADTSNWFLFNACRLDLSISQIASDDGILVYPNPAYEVLYINAEGNSAQTINICDLNGRLIKALPARHELDIRDLMNGVYVIELRDTDGVRRTRFVKM